MANQDKTSGATGVKPGVKPGVKNDETEGNRSADQKDQKNQNQDAGRNPGGSNPQQPRNQGDMREPSRNEGGNDQADGKR